MRSFLSIAMGFLVTLGAAGVGYAEPETGSAEVGHIETSRGTIKLVPVYIDNECYYRLETDNKDNALKPEDVRKTVARYDSILPKAFRSDAGIISKIVTEAEETKLQDAAREAHKSADKPQKREPVALGSKGKRACSCCGGYYYVSWDKQCNRVCDCTIGTQERIQQKVIDRGFKGWKFRHCSPMPKSGKCRDICKMDKLDQKTEKGIWGWKTIKQGEC
ncbi:MAG: hypothetical protein IKY83_09430 [Proteobacteria bacterium]|nr:hypothetical protein [Pseudomonadota bacterium]